MTSDVFRVLKNLTSYVKAPKLISITLCLFRTLEYVYSIQVQSWGTTFTFKGVLGLGNI